jgi:ATP:corrinoid adenosyltransferase
LEKKAFSLLEQTAETANSAIIQRKTPTSKGQSDAAMGLKIPKMCNGDIIAGRGFMKQQNYG